MSTIDLTPIPIAVVANPTNNTSTISSINTPTTTDNKSTVDNVNSSSSNVFIAFLENNNLIIPLAVVGVATIGLAVYSFTRK